MSDPNERSADPTSRRSSIVSLVLGIVALLGRLAYEAACADLGADLGIDSKGFRLGFNVGSLVLAAVGIVTAFIALARASSWRQRVGAPLPGVLTNGMAILWFLFFR